jgi:hypothetical protein
MSNLEEYLNKKQINTNIEDTRTQQSTNHIVIDHNIARKTNYLQP